MNQKIQDSNFKFIPWVEYIIKASRNCSAWQGGGGNYTPQNESLLFWHGFHKPSEGLATQRHANLAVSFTC